MVELTIISVLGVAPRASMPAPNPDSVPGRSGRDTAVLPAIVVFTTMPPESKRMPAASSPLLPLTTLSLMVRKEAG